MRTMFHFDHIHCARVFLAEASRRRHQPAFHATLLRWAANQRRRAAGEVIEIEPIVPERRTGVGGDRLIDSKYNKSLTQSEIEMFIVIDRDQLIMIGAARSQSHADAIAEVEGKSPNMIVCNAHDGGSWTTFSEEEMATLYKNMSQLTEAPEYGEAIEQLRAYVLSWTEYSVSEEELRARQADQVAQEAANSVPPDDPIQQELAQRKLHQDIIQMVETRNEEVGKKFESAKQNGTGTTADTGSKEPRKPGAVKRVWDIGDEIYKEKGATTDMKELRKLIMARCEQEGINPGTSGTQFGKWRTTRGYQ